MNSTPAFESGHEADSPLPESEPPQLEDPHSRQAPSGEARTEPPGAVAAGQPRASKLGLLVLLLLVLAGPLAVFWVRPPAALGLDAPAEEFSAERALESVQWLAAEPRPVGSDHHAEVRDRLLRELAELGLETELQEGTLPNWHDEAGGPLILKNILARVPADPSLRSSRNDALLLVAHYDSVRRGPGAGDDASGVAALLEALRALSNDEPRGNDLIVLISDGEELGLLGAKVFVQGPHPWFNRVGAVLNFEARGAGGPAVLFQVGPRSAGLIKRFAEVAPHAFGTSLATAVYERMPNDTDFTVFLGEGKPGLNFAFVGGGLAYHGPGDHPAALDLGSLQQHGEAMVSMARALSKQGPRELSDGPEVEFLLLPGIELIYPRALTLPLAIGLSLGFIAFVFLRAAGTAVYTRAGNLRIAAGVVGACLLAGAAGASVFYGAHGIYLATEWCASALGSGEPEPGSNLRSGEWLAAGAWVGALGVLLLLLGPIGRGRNPEHARRRLDALAAGSLLLFAGWSGALAVLVPGGGHIGILALLGVGTSLWWTSPRRRAYRSSSADPVVGTGPDRSGLVGVVGLVAWSPAAIALMPLLVLFVQVGSRSLFVERLYAAAMAGLALLSAMPLLAVVGARRERVGLVLVLASTVLLVLRALADLAVRVS